MYCVAYREHFSAYAEGDLAPAKREVFAAHLERCPACGPAFATFARGLDAMAAVRQDVAPVAPMGDRMLAVLGLPPRRRTWWARLQAPRARRWVAAAALLVGALIAVERLTPPLVRGAAVAYVAQHPEAAAAEPAVRDRVLTDAGFVAGPSGWTTPHALADAAKARSGQRRLDDRWLSPTEFGEAARRESGLVRVGDDWLRPAELDALRERAAGRLWFEGGWIEADALVARLMDRRGLVRLGDGWARPGAAATVEGGGSGAAETVPAAPEGFAGTAPASGAERVAAGPGAPAEAPASRAEGACTVELPASAPAPLRALLHGVRVLAPIPVGDALLLPLALPEGVEPPAELAVVPAAAAMAGRVLLVDEPRGAGVRAHNRGRQAILVVAGEIFIGGSQDRLVARDTIVAEDATLDLDVRCCERERSTPHAPGHVGFARLDALASPLLRRLLMTGGSQEAIWARIRALHARTGTTSPTEALQVTYDAASVRGPRGSARAALGAAAGPGSGVAGVAVVRAGKVELVDLFQDPAFFRGLMDGLAAGVVLDGGNADGVAGDPRQLVRDALVAAGTPAEPGGNGFIGLRNATMRGYATLHDDAVVHLCLAAPVDDAGAPTGPPGGDAGKPPVPPAEDPNYGELARKARRTEAEQREYERQTERRNPSGRTAGSGQPTTPRR